MEDTTLYLCELSFHAKIYGCIVNCEGRNFLGWLKMDNQILFLGEMASQDIWRTLNVNLFFDILVRNQTVERMVIQTRHYQDMRLEL